MYLTSLPTDENQLVFIRGTEVVVKPGGFLLWQTRVTIGTPQSRADLICFVEGTSTPARTGIVVHMTTPTIQSIWEGNATLEIANLGGLTFVLEEGDVIAQLTVATISSPPAESMKSGVTFQQKDVAATFSTSPPLD
jgi:deoxycytidine triphosphate deaminase